MNVIVDAEYQMSTGGSVYDGRQQVLYWADVSSEVAFVVPSTDAKITSSNSSGGKYLMSNFINYVEKQFFNIIIKKNNSYFDIN